MGFTLKHHDSGVEMETEFVWADQESLPDRKYIAVATLGNFRGHNNIELHIFRTDASKEELDSLRGLNLVGAADPLMPKELLAGATEDNALACILEAFTKEEAILLEKYLADHYGSQIKNLIICPMNLPVPLGVGPLSQIPEGQKSGFINFDLSKNFDLPFKFKGYYDLDGSN